MGQGRIWSTSWMKESSIGARSLKERARRPPSTGAVPAVTIGAPLLPPVFGGFIRLHRELMITLAAKHQLPTVYTERAFVTAGGLTSYGPDRMELSLIDNRDIGEM